MLRPAKRSNREIEVRPLAAAGISVPQIRSWAARWRYELRLPSGRLSIVIVGSDRMRRLNRTWRKQDRPTDVLAFGWPLTPVKHESTVGEVFLCPTMIRRRAPDFQRTYRQHFLKLLQHGLIHLTGLDHHTDRQHQQWTRVERRLSPSQL